MDTECAWRAPARLWFQGGFIEAEIAAWQSGTGTKQIPAEGSGMSSGAEVWS